MAFDFLISLVYVVLHTIVLFYHAVALSISLNSHNNILITLLISNNFVELKGSVFKKCERENLFQVVGMPVHFKRFQLRRLTSKPEEQEIVTCGRQDMVFLSHVWYDYEENEPDDHHHSMLALMKIIDATYESAKTGRPVDIA